VASRRPPAQRAAVSAWPDASVAGTPARRHQGQRRASGARLALAPARAAPLPIIICRIANILASDHRARAAQARPGHGPGLRTGPGRGRV